MKFYFDNITEFQAIGIVNLELINDKKLNIHVSDLKINTLDVDILLEKYNLSLGNILLIRNILD